MREREEVSKGRVDLGDLLGKDYSQPIWENVIFAVFDEANDATLNGLRAFFDSL